MTEKVTIEQAREHGLTDEEFDLMCELVGRVPNLTELGVFSAMWNEHCSYKSSKKWLKTLPTEADWVICGPGENAGVIDIEDGDAAIFKIESHNHPSYIEPYQGAATGVGGILRDVFTMGARPVALMNALRFGDPEHEKTRHFVNGVVSGIGGYGNCMGIPTVGGETEFHSAYNGNILVNAMAVGLAKSDKIFYATATGIGNPIVYVGAKTGRDGIHGSTMASAEFSEDAESKRPTVQVGDPFTEKLVMEACLELMESDAIIGIQDMGAAGLTCSSMEMASKGQVGVELHLEHLPTREPNMTPYEIMLSESQERMLMVLKPGREEEAREIFKKWGLDFAVIGHLTDTGRLVVKMNGETFADLKVQDIVDNSPEYDRPWKEVEPRPEITADDLKNDQDPITSLKQMMNTANLASKRWIYEQYDHMVMGDTVQYPGGDAGVVRVHGTKKALAITTDCSPRYCLAAPKEGGKQAVAEAWRNLVAVGAKPLAVTNNLNFGNPEKEEIMGQFVGCITGMREACESLEFPVISGNVSLYNETEGKAIMPTPVIGGVGLMRDVSTMMTMNFKSEGEDVYLIGGDDTDAPWVGSSLYLKEIEGVEDGMPPVVDLAGERKTGEFVLDLNAKELLTACHDVSAGGILVAAAEMAIKGQIGVQLDNLDVANAWWFGENQGRYVVTTKDGATLEQLASASGISMKKLGKTGGQEISIGDSLSVSLNELADIHNNWFDAYMSKAA